MIITHISSRDRKVRGTDIKTGDTLYAIEKIFDGFRLYFIWAYSDKAMAEYIDSKLDGPTSQADRQANWRVSLTALTPTGKRL